MASKNSAVSYNQALMNMQKSADATQIQLQKMINSSNEKQMTFNSAEAQKARDWQTKMSKTAHQMEVADLKKAGLNPVLSANGGAQSYTTSSASTQNDSGASALAALQSSQLSAIGNMESSRMSAEATKKAAELSSTATLKAARMNAIAQMTSAATSAEASKYAADQHRAASKYASDRQYAASKYHTDVWFANAKLDRKNQRWIIKNQTANSWAGIVDKTLRNSGIASGAGRVIKDAFASAGNFLKDPRQAGKYFANKGEINSKNFKLSKEGQKYVSGKLREMGVSPTLKNQHRFVKASVFFDTKAFGAFIKANPFATRPGYR